MTAEVFNAQRQGCRCVDFAFFSKRLLLSYLGLVVPPRSMVVLSQTWAIALS